jgi:hypothetical protein
MFLQKYIFLKSQHFKENTLFFSKREYGFVQTNSPLKTLKIRLFALFFVGCFDEENYFNQKITS